MISNAMIQKWIKMLRHDSVLHVEQSEGKHYSASEIAGDKGENELRREIINK